MLPPFQRILFINSQHAHEEGYLLLANGPSIFTFHAESGKYQAKWQVGDAVEPSILQSEHGSPEPEAGSQKEGPPVKKRKTAIADTISDASSAEIVIEHGGDTKRPPKKRPNDLPSVINLCGSQDGKYVIVATSEDKCIRVLVLSPDGKLSTLNERFLPKKASALVLSIDQQTILCADKFGDVYGLPLLPPKIQSVDSVLSTPNANPSIQSQGANSVKPAASTLTVHTKKNLAALRNQLAQSAKGLEANKPRIVEYQPLLGHVSLLTDILNVQVVTEKNKRSYILTADRDEHIRISRGMPQAHITEGFCLGHTQFVSRLCVPIWNSRMLVSGGGDDFLVCWDWMNGSIEQRVTIRPELNRLREAHGLSQDSPIAVSGIWAIQTKEESGTLVVACEGVAALLTFDMDKEGSISLSTTLQLASNVLDACVIPSRKAIAYVMDNVREPYSTTNVRMEQDTVQVGMHRWSDSGFSWEEMPGAPISELRLWNSQQSVDAASSSGSKGTDLYYSLEHLRKQVGTESIEQES